jgi:hypothetical protein
MRGKDPLGVRSGDVRFDRRRSSLLTTSSAILNNSDVSITGTTSSDCDGGLSAWFHYWTAYPLNYLIRGSIGSSASQTVWVNHLVRVGQADGHSLD